MAIVGTWVLRTEYMLNATGGVILLAPDGAICSPSSSGTVQMPMSSDPTALYLDGSNVPTAVADLPTGWKPDDAYKLHSTTYCAQAEDTCDYVFVALGVSPHFVGPISPIPPAPDVSLTGMTLAKLIATFGEVITISMVAGNFPPFTNETLVQNYAAGVWDDTINISLTGTYRVVSIALPPLPPLPIRTPIAQGRSRG